MARKKATRKRQRTTRGWRRSAPKTQAERRRLYKKCGPGAFLKPNPRDPDLSAYPVMAKGTMICALDCRGLRSAYSRANQYGDYKVARKAKRLAEKAGCGWVRK